MNPSWMKSPIGLLMLVFALGLVMLSCGGDGEDDGKGRDREVTGSLGDAVADDGGGGVDEVQEDRLRDAEAELRANPQSADALATVVQVHFAKALGERDEATGLFNARGRQELLAAADAWERYLATDPSPPSADVAELMSDIYGLLGAYDKAEQSAQIVADRNPTVDAYLALARYASFANHKQSARKAGDKAIELAAGGERANVEQQVDQVLKEGRPPRAPAQAGP
jgi:hypothetical protein